jgi:hypothetical protein
MDVRADLSGLYSRSGCQEGHVCLFIRGSCIYSCRLETGKLRFGTSSIVLVPVFQAVIYPSSIPCMAYADEQDDIIQRLRRAGGANYDRSKFD